MPEPLSQPSAPGSERSATAPGTPPTGVIEGFFGRPWSWEARRDAVDFMARAGFHFYLYAPKADACLRRQWQSDWPEEQWRELRRLREHCKRRGIRFGVGLSPLELYRAPAGEAREQLTRKIDRLNRLSPDILCLLFDDMRGDLPELAQRQVELAHVAADATRTSELFLCPTYYSPDPILEKVFGPRPPHYWRDLGQGLDPAIRVFWTGPEVCSRHYPTDHLAEVTDWLGRPPLLWDNYPVNDSAKLCPYLRLSPYPVEHSQLAGRVAGHAVNPMNQAYLSRIPLATLPMVYARGAEYRPEIALRDALEAWCPSDLAPQLRQDLPLLENSGLNHLTEAERRGLRLRYQPYRRSSPLAREILDWLEGGYAFDPACLTD